MAVGLWTAHQYVTMLNTLQQDRLSGPLPVGRDHLCESVRRQTTTKPADVASEFKCEWDAGVIVSRATSDIIFLAWHIHQSDIQVYVRKMSTDPEPQTTFSGLNSNNYNESQEGPTVVLQ